jgi:hypothetical protein
LSPACGHKADTQQKIHRWDRKTRIRSSPQLTTLRSRSAWLFHQ